jgi:hypothetical protein
MKKPDYSPLIVIIFVFAFITQLFSQEPMSTEKLVKESDVIATGKVTKIKCEWNRPKDFIWSYVTLEIQNQLKGCGGKELIIKEGGGELDGRKCEASYADQYKISEPVLVFLKRMPGSIYRLTEQHRKYKIVGESAVNNTRGKKYTKQFLNEIKTLIEKQANKN